MRLLYDGYENLTAKSLLKSAQYLTVFSDFLKSKLFFLDVCVSKLLIIKLKVRRVDLKNVKNY